MMIGDKISKVIGVESEGLKRLFFYIYILGNIIFTIVSLLGLFLFLIGSNVNIIYWFIGIIFWTPFFFLFLYVIFQLIINPIIWIVDGFDDKK